MTHALLHYRSNKNKYITIKVKWLMNIYIYVLIIFLVNEFKIFKNCI